MEPPSLPHTNGNSHMYIDGGVICNYPIYVFDGEYSYYISVYMFTCIVVSAMHQFPGLISIASISIRSWVLAKSSLSQQNAVVMT